ncbi:hypothetical protein Hanom_Chr12g01123181 [Helianthus anomalus]
MHNQARRTDLHCPTVTWSPSFTRKHGEMCAGMFECLFSEESESYL